MCQLCSPLGRRAFCAGAALMPLSLGPPHDGGLLEPSLRLAPAPGPAQLAVTLDACPGWFDPRVATALVALGIPAAIFVTAVWMAHNRPGLAYFLAHPDIFTLENHGARHLPAVLGARRVYGLPIAGTLPAIRAEVEDGARAVAAATGRAPLWYRGAAGLYSPAAIPFIQSLGVRIAGYSLNSDEGASLPAAAVARRLEAARPGDVIEGHVNQPARASGAGIAAGLAALRARGVNFVKLNDSCVFA